MIIVAKSDDLTGSGHLPGCLSVVATPIGNMGDLSARAREVLASCDLVAAEDTRHTRGLLRHFGINKPLLSLHEHNERERIGQLLARLGQGKHIALVSDAGTPGISDPGFALVRACAEAGVRIQPIPGPCAAIAALCAAGLPTDRFCFEGFLPAAPGARLARLRQLADEQRTLVLHESAHRIVETLDACIVVLGTTRAAVLARELTKQFETLYRGTLQELSTLAHNDANVSRGELVLVIHGAPESHPDADAVELDRVLGLLLKELPLRQAAQLAARITGCRDNHAYRRALELQRAGATHGDDAP